MLILLLIIIPALFMFIKICTFLFVRKFGKISYKNFDSFGFKYNQNKDTFDATKNAWQKNYGYTRIYDVGAPLFGMIIDTQPVKFYYNNKNWLICFWKGQYGITSGGEVGIYNTTAQTVTKNTIYYGVKEEEMLNMSFSLFNKKTFVTNISDKHWWLATFKLGMFSKVKDLSMCIKIEFPNDEMLNAFMTSFKKLKYKKKYYYVDGTTFSFDFKKAKTKKVWTRFWLTDAISQFWNKKKVYLYNEFIDDLTDRGENKIDINTYIPDIFKNDIGYKYIGLE